MHILHVIVGLNVGGAELMLKRLIESQLGEGRLSHSVVSLTDIGSVGPALQAKGVEVRSLNGKGWLNAPLLFFKLFRVILETKPDIVQTWMYHADLLGGLAARLAGVRRVIWGIRTTDLTKNGKKTTIGIQKICAALSRYVPTAIVCAAEASRRAHAAAGYDATKMTVIPNGFDLSSLYCSPEERELVRAACGISATDIVIGSLGRFNPVKDHGNFIAAAALLLKKYPNLKFLLVGRDIDGDNLALTEDISATGKPNNFFLLGERRDVASCLNAMDIFCLHSRTEGFPNVLGEAMAIGLPCVSTDVGDAAYLLDGCGVVVRAEDPQALMEGIDELLERGAAQRAALGGMARSRIEADFSMTKAAERFMNLYASVAAVEWSNGNNIK